MTVKGEEQGTIDHRLLKALSHPLRQRILIALHEGVASPSQLAQELDEPLGNVSYHVKMLAELDAVDLVKTEPVRGALEHFYRPTLRPQLDDDHWARLPLSARRTLFDQTLQQIWDVVSDAASGGGLDDLKTHLSRTSLELDDQAYDELVDCLTATLERAIELNAEAANRLALLDPTERESRRTELVIMHFHRSDGGRSSDRAGRASRDGKRAPARTT